MGQPVTVIERPSSRGGIIRFEANRVLSGTGHMSFRSPADIAGSTPAHEAARLLFETGEVDGVHVNGNVVTVDLKKGGDSSGMKALLESMFLHYR